jgi:hypothetical protein
MTLEENLYYEPFYMKFIDCDFCNSHLPSSRIFKTNNNYNCCSSCMSNKDRERRKYY